MKVLIAIDESGWAEKAFEWYVNNLHQDENQVFVCSEAEEPKFPTVMFACNGAFPAEKVYKIVNEHTKKLKDLKKLYLTKCKENNIANFEVLINCSESKHSGRRIVQKAESLNVGMIVIGTRGMGKLRRAFLGSVSDYVVRNANAPVVVCRHS